MMDRKNHRKLPKDDMTKAGSLVTLETPYSESELAMVLKYVSKNDLTAYCRKNKIVRDEESEIWRCNYAVLGHYKKQEFLEILKSMKFDEKPTLNLLIVKVNSKTSFNVVAGNAPEMQLLFSTIREIAQSDNSISELLDQLVKVCTLTLMTDDLKKQYREALEKKLNEKDSEKIDSSSESEEKDVELSDEEKENLSKLEKEIDEEINDLEEKRKQENED